MRIAFIVALAGLLAAGTIIAPSRAEWQQPQNIGATINTAAGEWYPVLATDGSFMIFVSDRAGGFGQTDLWISYNIGGDWQTPVNMGANVNSSAVESAPYLAPGDSVLYFASFVSGGHGGMDVYRCPLSFGIPGAKENAGSPINTAWLDCCPVISHDGQRFFVCSTRPGGFGSMDVWEFEWTGSAWGSGVNAGSLVNSTQTDCPRWISDDGEALVLSSTRGGGMGNADLWLTTRQGGEWGPLENFGPVINTAAEEWGPDFLDNQGAVGGVIYFGSARAGGHGGRDIWSAVEQTTAVPGAEPGLGTRLRIYPNPHVHESGISFSLGERSGARIRVFDVHGRLVRTLLDGDQPAGDYRVVWDGMTAAGISVAPGVYFVEALIGNTTMTRRITVLRE
jgi:hypothetical protein